jgi:hypothetical protein
MQLLRTAKTRENVATNKGSIGLAGLWNSIVTHTLLVHRIVLLCIPFLHDGLPKMERALQVRSMRCMSLCCMTILAKAS